MSIKVIFYDIIYVYKAINMLFAYYAIYGNVKIYENKMRIFSKNLHKKRSSH